MANKNNRIRILSPDEINAYFGQPKFTATERTHYLHLSKDELELCNTLSINTRWYFILLLGYFKAKHQIFMVNYSAAKLDIHFVNQTYGIKNPHKSVSEDTHRKIRKMIIKHMGFNDNHKYVIEQLQLKAQELISTTPDMKFVFQSLYDHAANKDFVIPQHTTFQTIISKAMTAEYQRLQKILNKHLPQYAIKLLKKLLSVKDNYYEITSVKKDQKKLHT